MKLFPSTLASFSCISLSFVATLAASLSVLPPLQRSAQAQSCSTYRGNLDALPGDSAIFQVRSDGQPITILSGAADNADTLATGTPGDVVLIRTEAVAQDTCYRWFYIEVQDASLSQGWVRGDQLGTNPLTPEPVVALDSTCSNLRGNIDVMAGDTAQLQTRADGLPIAILSGAAYSGNALDYGTPGEAISIRSDATNYRSCYRWLYVESQSSGSQGWVRGDQVKSTDTDSLVGE